MSGIVRVTNESAMALAATSTMSHGSENVAPPAVIAAQSKHTLAASVPREAVDPQLVQQWVTGLVSMIIDNGLSIA